MDIAGYHIPSLAAAAAAFGAVYGAFARFDKDQSEDNRKFATKFLAGLKVDHERWNQFFEELFSRLFGSKHLSLKCATRSFFLSAALIIGIFSIFSMRALITSGYIDRLMFANLEVVLICICVGDYFSLWKTRVLLTQMNLFRNGLAAFAIVVGDFVATSLVFLTMWLAAVVLFDLVILGHPFTWRQIWFSALYFRVLVGSTIYEGPHLNVMTWWLYGAALLTSAWLWVYLIVAYGIRSLTLLLRGIKPLSKFMDFENHPVRTIGYVAATISAVIVGAISII